MNFKKTVISLFAAGTLLVSGGMGAMAQTSSSTTQGSVTVTDDGTFNVVFCESFSFDPVTINSTNPSGTSEGTLGICYTDTEADRGTFRTYMQAGHFVGPTDWFANSNVKPAFMYNVLQTQWGEGYGNIGAMKGNGNYSSGSGGYVNNAASAGVWTGNDLSSPQYVGYGNAGIGTTLSYAQIDLALTVPTGLDGGTYVSDFTLNVNPATP